MLGLIDRLGEPETQGYLKDWLPNTAYPAATSLSDDWQLFKFLSLAGIPKEINTV
jgi:hypothetical protein